MCALCELTSLRCHRTSAKAVAQPPIWSIMSEGHSTALRRSLSECLKEWMTPPRGTLGLSHLLMAAEGELALVVVVLLYREKA